ncbi:MAG: 16S rRNA (adenine(1518)-N(6)/adenine(1519)-N(6))-dimethyltransferase RsmA [Acidobacteriia bacterium]|nr:16S rRNA (adenine(1518)-N(6)/adenine(1519)-N(6))-dimethyltransferase RsmA [Terriglobia bacterium]
MPRQKLGQHFLIKGSVLERIAAAACPARADLVVEIGPGRGALTEKLLKRAARVIAIELDPHLAEHLRRRFAAEPRLEVVQADVLATDLAQWGRAAIAGNLPYYITSPILERTLRLDIPRAVFLMQKEVAERVVAGPGTSAYGFLSAHTALFADARLLFAVRPAAFYPPPKVESAVVLLEPRRHQLEIGDRQAFLRFIGQCFSHKRKTIRNNLAALYGKETIDAWPEAGLRAEQISLDQFAEMYRRLEPATHRGDAEDAETTRRRP